MAFDPLDVSGPWGELLHLTGGNQDMQQTLQTVVQVAKRTIPGAEGAAITLIRRGRAGTIASTGGMSEVLDELQYEAGYGPCLDAGRSNQIVHITDATTEARWPRYLPAAREAGLASSLSLPVPVENYLFGALNLYATSPDNFTPESVELGDGLAVHICAVLSRAEAVFAYRDEIEQLRRAMDTRAVIEQAKGMLMAQDRCSAAEAFTALRTMSMNRNLKLTDLAAGIVAGADTFSGAVDTRPSIPPVHI